MTHFCVDENSIRVDLFKPSGKWYTTISVKMNFTNPSIHNSLQEAIKEKYPTNYEGMTAVCLNPFHKFSHPVMLTVK